MPGPNDPRNIGPGIDDPSGGTVARERDGAYERVTGHLSVYPITNPAQAAAALQYAVPVARNAQRGLFEYMSGREAQGDLFETAVDKETGRAIVYRIEQSKLIDPDTGKPYPPGTPEYEAAKQKNKVVDPFATRLFSDFYNASQDIKAITEMLESGVFGAADDYVSTEVARQNEARRQFADFFDRASALYNLQNQERDWAKTAAEHNASVKQDSMKGYVNWAAAPYMHYIRPGNVFASQAILPTLPSEIPPDYRLNHVVGLPGGGGFDYPRGGNTFTIPMRGYAYGTAPVDESSPYPLPPPPAPPSSNPDPHLDWMIGLNPFAFGVFDPRGKVLRGFIDEEGLAAAQAQGGVMP